MPIWHFVDYRITKTLFSQNLFKFSRSVTRVVFTFCGHNMSSCANVPYFICFIIVVIIIYGALISLFLSWSNFVHIFFCFIWQYICQMSSNNMAIKSNSICFWFICIAYRKKIYILQFIVKWFFLLYSYKFHKIDWRAICKSVKTTIHHKNTINYWILMQFRHITIII